MIYFVGMDKWEFVDKLSLVYHVGIFDWFSSVTTHTTKSQSTGSIDGQKDLLFNVSKNKTHILSFKLIKTIAKKCWLFVK